MITALWRQAHLIPKHGQLLARLSPRRDVYVFWVLQKPSPRPSKVSSFCSSKLQQDKNSVERRGFDHAPKKNMRELLPARRELR